MNEPVLAVGKEVGYTLDGLLIYHSVNAVQAHIYSYGQLKIPNEPNMYDYGLWTLQYTDDFLATKISLYATFLSKRKEINTPCFLFCLICTMSRSGFVD